MKAEIDHTPGVAPRVVLSEFTDDERKALANVKALLFGFTVVTNGALTQLGLDIVTSMPATPRRKRSR